MASAVMSGLLYAAEVWKAAMKWGSAMASMNRMIRLLAVRICSAYRTVQADDVMVVAGICPAEVAVEARAKRWDRDKVYAEWQARWARRESWTKTLIPEVREWCERGYGEVDYYVTQFLTGHGENGRYLERIKKRNDGRCVDCGEYPRKGDQGSRAREAVVTSTAAAGHGREECQW
ncbi:uncharacterized protein LOC116161869 [Photinus pyralis]|uniref:uncharacterized protein LOC116161869 n=1 Tax=Photinus pyralis TaxID=7054 RepID=UPI00126739DE|nr:uncharacterized protein LOC116161869 [Photinus pyralis]